MTDRELMQMALDALKANDKLINGEGNRFGLVGAMDGYYSGCFDIDGVDKQTESAIKALRERLSQPEPEPVAWGVPYDQAIDKLMEKNSGL